MRIWVMSEKNIKIPQYEYRSAGNLLNNPSFEIHHPRKKFWQNSLRNQVAKNSPRIHEKFKKKQFMVKSIFTMTEEFESYLS